MTASPEKLSARAWVAVMLQVHRRGLASTCTLLAGHIERPADFTDPVLTLVALQRHAHRQEQPGFSECILLLTPQARLPLAPWIVHHQPSWVKLALRGASTALRWGCDDLGGTLMEEHITTMAAATGGASQSVTVLEAAPRGIGRPVRERTSRYGVTRRPRSLVA